MGKTIEQVAKDQGYEVVAIVDDNNFKAADITHADVAIEFTQPDVAFSNIKK